MNENKVLRSGCSAFQHSVFLILKYLLHGVKMLLQMTSLIHFSLGSWKNVFIKKSLDF